MLYRLAHIVNSTYGLAVAWCYIAVFIVAFCLMFIFPPMTVALLFIGLASLGVTVSLGWLIAWFTRVLARRALSRGRCPRCSEAAQGWLNGEQAWVCTNCASEFGSDGAEIDADERARYVDVPPDDPDLSAVREDLALESWREP